MLEITRKNEDRREVPDSLPFPSSGGMTGRGMILALKPDQI
jgi:hypothetical protein